jgi:predicted heme/steroid binding protein
MNPTSSLTYILVDSIELSGKDLVSFYYKGQIVFTTKYTSLPELFLGTPTSPKAAILWQHFDGTLFTMDVSALTEIVYPSGGPQTYDALPQSPSAEQVRARTIEVYDFLVHYVFQACCGIAGGGTPGEGTVTSVGFDVDSAVTALQVLGGPITLSGAFSLSFLGDSTQYVRGDGTLATFPTVGGGTVTSVNASIGGTALDVSGVPITTIGTIAFAWQGDDTQVVLGDGTLASLPTSNTYNGNQGVYKDTSVSPEAFMLGAPSGLQSAIKFQEDRFVDADINSLSFEGTGSFVVKSYTPYFVGIAMNGNAPSGIGVRGTSNDAGSKGVEGNSKDGTGVVAISTNYYGLHSSSTGSVNALFTTDSTNVPDVLDLINIKRGYTGSGVGIGSGSAIVTSLNNVVGTRISSFIESGTSPSTYSIALGFQTKSSGVPISTKMEINGAGGVKLNQYGTGSFTGTTTHILGVDASGNVTETSSSALVNIYNSDGTLTDTRTLNGDAFNLTFNNITNFVLETLSSTDIRSISGSDYGLVSTNIDIAYISALKGSNYGRVAVDADAKYSKLEFGPDQLGVEAGPAYLKVITPNVAAGTATTGQALTYNASTGQVEFTTISGGSAAWGSIGAGTGVGSQTDLVTYLDANYYPLSSNPAGYLTSASLAGYVPYTGATADLDMGTHNVTADHVALNVSPSGAGYVVGATQWNNSIGSSETLLKGGNVSLKNGVDLVARIVNKVVPNTTLTKAAYQAVRISGATGGRLSVSLARANADVNSADTIGLVCETITTNQEGFIIVVGQLLDVNTTGSLQGETWADGDVLYLSPTTAGALTNVKPNGSTGHIVVIGYVEYSHAVNGSIYVKVMNGWELDELHNVYISSPVNNDVLRYNSTTQLWVNSSIPTILGYTPVTQARTLTINGTAYDLSADRSWSVGDLLSSGSYGNPTWLTSLAASKITGTLAIANGGTNSSTTLSNNRVMRSSGGAIVEAAAITASRALVSDTNGIPTHSTTTSTELGYVSGVTSAIQTQINSLVPQSRTITIDGTTYDLSANRTWTTTGSRQSALVATPGTNVGINTTTYSGLASSSNSTEGNRQSVFGLPTTFTGLGIITNNAQTATGNLVFTLRVAGADTALTYTVVAGSAAGVFTASGSVAAGGTDRVAIKIQNTSTSVASATVITITTTFTI